MKYISLEELQKHIIRDECDDGCGYIDERDISSMPTVEFDKIKAEVLTIPQIDSDGHNNNWYREPQEIIDDVLRIIDKHIGDTTHDRDMERH